MDDIRPSRDRVFLFKSKMAVCLGYYSKKKHVQCTFAGATLMMTFFTGMNLVRANWKVKSVYEPNV